MIRYSPTILKHALNIYGPYWGTGISINHISADWHHIRVSMKMRWYNRNIVGVHFGGSLYAMVDPPVMLMLQHILGRDYIVWDQAAEIEYLKPGKGKVTADVIITEENVELIKQEAADGKKYFYHHNINIVDEQQEAVCRVKKIIYIRRKSTAS